MILYLDAHIRGRAWVLAMERVCDKTGDQVVALLNHESEVEWFEEQGLKHFIVIDVKKHFAEKAVVEPRTSDSVGINRIREFILCDRRLRNLDDKESFRYAFAWLDLIETLTQKFRFKVCIGEPTWFNELLVFEFLKGLNIECVEPSPNRFDLDRFMFLSGISEDYVIRRPHAPERNSAEKWAENVINGLENKSINQILSINMRDRKLDLRFIKNSLKMVLLAYVKRRNRFIHTNILQAIRSKILFVFRKNTVRSYLEKSGLRSVPEEDFVFYPLHLQPERTIDVMGSKQSNVFEAIRQMSINWEFPQILVKEHPTCIGRRPKSFYRKLNSIPGVRIVSPSVSTHCLITKAKFVYSVSGTSLIEASVLGTPAGSGSQTYFTKVLSHGQVSPFERLPEAKERVHVKELLVEMYENSFPGSTLDPIMDSKVLSTRNLENLEFGFYSLLEALSANK